MILLSMLHLFHNDVGLLGAMSRLNAKTIATGDTIFAEFKGALAEQYVFQQLSQNDRLSIYYHTFDKSKYELDFFWYRPKTKKLSPSRSRQGKI